MTAAHKPTPWPAPNRDPHDRGAHREWWEIDSICRVYSEADALLIWRAVNAHEALISTLKTVQDVMVSGALYADEGGSLNPKSVSFIVSEIESALTNANMEVPE